VSVPATAVSGPISVSVGSSSVSSAQSFTVTPGSGAPTITSFAPASGGAGTVITITGTRFAPPLTKVLLNGSLLPVTSATDTQLVVTLAANVATGPIQVVTPAGVATSSSYFLVLRPGQTAADIGATGTVTQNGATVPLTLANPNQLALAYFSGTQADLNVRVMVDPAPSFAYTAQVYDPRGAPIGASFGISPGFIDLPRLPRNGIYTVQVNVGANTGNVGVTVGRAELRNLDLTWQSNANISSGFKARKTHFQFSGTQYQNIVLSISNGSLTNTTGDGYPRRTLFDSAGNVVWQGNVTCCSPVDVVLPQLTKTDTYTLVVDPGRYGGSEAFSAGIRTSLTLDGTAGVLALLPNGSLPVVGRAAFQGTAGQTVTLRATPSSLFGISPQSAWVSLWYGAPGASPTFLMTQNLLQPTYSIQVRQLPATTTYYLEVTPGNAQSPMAVQLLSAPGGSNLTNASPFTLTIPNQNQLAKLTFTGNSGEYIGVGLPTNNMPVKQAWILDPNQTQIFGTQQFTALNAVTTIPLGPLTASGTYTMYVLPTATNLFPASPASSNVTYSFDSGQASGGSDTVVISTPVTGTLTIGGSTVPINISRAGQSARFTFTGTSGQAPKFYSTNVTFTGGSFCQAALGLYRPGETGTRTYQGLLSSSNTSNPIIYPTSSGNANVINFVSFSQTGTYTIEIQTMPGCTVNLTGRLSLT